MAFSSPFTVTGLTTPISYKTGSVPSSMLNYINDVIPLCFDIQGGNTVAGTNIFTGANTFSTASELNIEGTVSFTNSVSFSSGFNIGSYTLQAYSGGFQLTGITYLEGLTLVGTTNINTSGSAVTTIGNAGGPSTISVAGPITFSNTSTFNNTTNINNTSGTGNTNIGYPTNTTDIVGAVNINATGSSPTAIGSNSGGNGVVIGGIITINGSVISNANIDVVGSFTASNLNIIGNSILAGTLTVNNTTVLNGTLSVSGTSLLESVTANGILSAGAGFGISAGPIVYTFVPNGATTFTILTSMVMVYYNGSGNCAYTLPSSASAGFRVEIWSGNSTGSTITSASTVNGSSGATLGTAYQRYTLVCLGGTSWLLSS